MNRKDERLDCERTGSGLKCTPEERRAGIIRIVNEGNATGGWRDLFQCLEHLAEYRQFQVREAGDVAAGPREALHPTDADRIAYPRNDDRDGAKAAIFNSTSVGPPTI